MEHEHRYHGPFTRSRSVRASLRGGALALVCLLVLACQNDTPVHWTVAAVHEQLPLEGAHRDLTCGQCHGAAGLTRLAAECEACHLAAYDTTTAPAHRAAGYPTDCSRCHGTTAWTRATFDHADAGFALTGAHGSATCTSCHTQGQWTGLSADCISCHQQSYDATTQPPHATLGYPTTCADCHGTTAWTPATFDHAAAGFPLTGAHGSATCTSCHTQGQWTGLPADCISCHQQDEPPLHFGPDCGACHTSTAWRPSTFDHEQRFPLQVGSHQRYRSSCGSCHPTSTDYVQFTCTECHDRAHARALTDAQHDEVLGYRYESAACYRCHPSGRSEGGEGGD